MGKFSTHYTKEELKAIKEQWLRDKKRIDNEAGFIIHPNEEPLIIEVYRGVLSDGYYTESKIKEKKVCAHFGKAISRQYRPKNK